MKRRPPDALDDPDKAIVELLQEDGRRSYTGIAAAVGLSEAAVRTRVQRLIEGNVVQIVGVTDPLRLGFEIVCEYDDNLLSILNDKIFFFNDTATTEIYTYLRLHKQTYAWGTR